jgi:glycosyltransferase involved in cell wall biosynthesis
LQTAVYIPSDTAVVYPPVVPTHAARTSVGGTSHRFGFIGRIENNKGIALLLEAASRLGEKVLVAGSGDDALRVTLEARFPGQADWCGWVEPGQFFRRIDVLVVPSLWPEPFGRVVAEAAAYGVPVIATAVGGIPEAAAISRAEVMLVPPTLSGLVDAMRNPRFARSSDQPAGSSLLTVVDQALRSPG